MNKSLSGICVVCAALVAPSMAHAVTVALRYEQKVTAQPGPMPGTVVLRSVLRAVDPTSSPDSRSAGRITGECFTLVRAELDRDFASKPAAPGDILGFSCRDIPE